jgi:CubicO group peptidase (beta-lactamase class C family)
MTRIFSRLARIGLCALALAFAPGFEPGFRPGFAPIFAPFLATGCAAQPDDSLPGFNETEILQILRDRVDADRRSVGMVIAVVSEQGSRVYGYGSVGDSTGSRPDGDTVFEIGSVTKVFTAILLDDLAMRGKVGLDDPLAKYLPDSVRVPERDGRAITLRDLATHTSGLPRVPTFDPPLVKDPLEDFAVADLYRFLDGYALPREIGSVREYSNLGYALLGHALSRATGKEYGELVQARIAMPLGMRRTATSLTPEMASRGAFGHDEELRPVQSQRLGVHASAGGIYSTANDLLVFLAANLGLTESPFSLVLRDARECRYGVPGSDTKLSLAWGECTEMHGVRLFSHDGGTEGFSSFIAFDRDARRGVVVLSNSHFPVYDIAVHLLQPRYPLVRRRTAITLDRSVLDRYTGVYEITPVGPGVSSPSPTRTITRYRDRLFMTRTGQPTREIFPWSERDFFLDATSARLSFDGPAGSRPDRITYVQANGDTTVAARTDRVPGLPRSVVEVDPATFDRLVGVYEIGPGVRFTITRDGEKLLAQVTGQIALEIFPLSETRFFYTAVDAEIGFEMGPDGRVRRLICYEGKDETRAERVQ